QTSPRLPQPISKLLSDPEGIDEPAVPVNALGLEVIEKLPPLADELEQAPTRVMVLGVHLEVLGQVRDALGQKRNLDLGRAGITLVLLKFLNRVCFPAGGEAHLKTPVSLFA